MALLALADKWWLLPLGALTVFVYSNFEAIERVLRHLALLFLTYVAAAFLARPDWHDVLHHWFVPSFDFRRATVSGPLALLGTTLSACVVTAATGTSLYRTLTRCGQLSAPAGRAGPRTRISRGCARPLLLLP